MARKKQSNLKPNESMMSEVEVKYHLKLHNLPWKQFRQWYGDLMPWETDQYFADTVEAYVDWRLTNGKGN